MGVDSTIKALNLIFNRSLFHGEISKFADDASVDKWVNIMSMQRTLDKLVS